MGIKLSILVIGERKGRILKGVWVDFSGTILKDYESCLDDIFEHFLAFIYRAKHQEKSLRETLTITEKATLNDYIIHQDYIDNSNVIIQEVDKWIALHKKISEDKHPLLPMEQCIHLRQGLWNRSKGGSDTAIQAFRSA